MFLPVFLALRATLFSVWSTLKTTKTKRIVILYLSQQAHRKEPGNAHRGTHKVESAGQVMRGLVGGSLTLAQAVKASRSQPNQKSPKFASWSILKAVLARVNFWSKFMGLLELVLSPPGKITGDTFRYSLIFLARYNALNRGMSSKS